MNRFLAALILTAAVSAAAAVKDADQSYWERDGFTRNRGYASIALRDKDIEKLAAKIEKLMSAEGAKLTNVCTDGGEQPAAPQSRPSPRKILTFSAPASRVEAIGFELTLLASVECYSSSPAPKTQSDPLAEVVERIAVLEAERAAHKKALKGMPVARALYAAKLARLRRARETLEESGDRATISVALAAADAAPAR